MSEILLLHMLSKLQDRPTTVTPKVKKQQIVFDLDSKEDVTAKSTDGQSSEDFTIQIGINSSGSR